jgi:hypothetical protein
MSTPQSPSPQTHTHTFAAMHEESAADDAFATCGCAGFAFLLSLELLLLQSRDKASDAASEVRESEHRRQMLGGKPSSPNAQECYPKLHGGTPTFLLGCIMDSIAGWNPWLMDS